MVFSEVVSMILFATSPEKIKLALCNPIFDPVVVHVECFMTLQANLGCEDVMGSGVVSLDGGSKRSLRVYQFHQSFENGNCFLGTQKSLMSQLQRLNLEHHIWL